MSQERVVLVERETYRSMNGKKEKATNRPI